ncbi:unnamed protein product [Parajaminaea phylloscopi]
MSGSTSTVHLLVACHGLWGQPLHLRYLVEQLIKSCGGEISPTGADPDPAADGTDDEAATKSQGNNGHQAQSGSATQPRLVVLIPDSNADTRTYDGIDWCSERIVEDIERERQRLRKLGRTVVRFSILGYSLGGLMARYTVGLLHSKGFFETVQPVSFTTLSTPHLGVPRTSGWFSQVAAAVGSRFLGRTGQQLYLRDNGWDTSASSPSPSSLPRGRRPKSKATLLEALADPASNFIKGLQMFQHTRIYANAVSDPTVPFRTGALMDVDPWAAWPVGGLDDVEGKGVKYERDGEYPALITSITIPSAPPTPRSLRSRLAAAKWPFWLNPRSVPWRFPLNYLLVFLFPIAMPLLISLLIFRLWRGTRASNRRVKELEREWLQGTGVTDNAHYTHDHERSRILSVVTETVRAIDEDYVDESQGGHTSRSDSNNAAKTSTKSEASRRPAWSSPSHLDVTPEVRAFLAHRQPPLSAKQTKMWEDLHASLPKLRKYLAFFEEVRNSHAIIICRTPSIEVHRRGATVVAHFVDHFEL